LGGKDRFRPITGLPVSTYFSAYKFLWMYENVPNVKASVDSGDALVGTVDSWLIYELTGGARNGGVHLTDATNASRTNLMSLATLDWHDEFLPLFHLSRSALPRIISNSELFGHVTSGPMSGVPIMGCLGDQQAALLGQRCIEGEAKNTYGTGCFLLLNTGKTPVPSSHGLLTTLGYKLGPEKEACYALEGSVAVGGMGFSWLRDNLHIIDSPEEAQTLASSVDDTAGVYFVPAFSGLMAPRWIDSARGVIVGLTLASTRAHICRAMHEAIAFQSLEVLNAMIKDSGIGKLSVLRVDGGAVQNSLLMQMQASIAQTDVQVPQFRETTALGAALASGLAAGFWTEGQVFAHPYSFTSYHPKMTADEADKKLASWCKAVSISLDLASL
jgi:glycerol kinase